MTVSTIHELDPCARPATGGTQKGTAMLLHEVLARSRQREAEEAARQWRLARAALARRRRRRVLAVLAAPLRRETRRWAAQLRRSAGTP